MSNTKSRPRDYNTILRKKAFRDGMEDARADQDPATSSHQGTEGSLVYTYGRLFAVARPDISIAECEPAYGMVAQWVIDAFIEEHRNGTFC